MTERVAITGATGYVGSALAERLAQEGASVRGLARRTSSRDAVAWLRARGVGTVEGDVTDAGALERLVQGADVVYHCAAVIGYRRRLVGAMQRTNVAGTQEVVRACRRTGIGRLVHMSSVAAIGVSDRPEPMDETTPYNGDVLRAAYFDTKHAAEVCVLGQAGPDLDAVAVNPGAIYGPSGAPSNSGHVVSSAVRGRLRFVPKGGVNAVPLATVIECTLAAARRGRCGERYVVPGDNLTVLHLVRRIGAAAGVQLDPLMLPAFVGPVLRLGMDLAEPFVPDRVWFTPDLCACFNRFLWFAGDKARRELGVESHSLDEALAGQVEQMRREGRL